MLYTQRRALWEQLHSQVPKTVSHDTGWHATHFLRLCLQHGYHVPQNLVAESNSPAGSPPMPIFISIKEKL